MRRCVKSLGLLAALWCLLACDGRQASTRLGASTASPQIATVTVVTVVASPTTTSTVQSPLLVPSSSSAANSLVALPTAQAFQFEGGCSTDEVARFVRRYLDAFNEGDPVTIERFFPAKASPYKGMVNPVVNYLFHWYTVGRRDESNFTAYSREELLPYLAQRHAHRERLTLLKLDIAGPGLYGGPIIGFRLTREANDLPTRIVEGKSTIDCVHNTILIWVMYDSP